MKKLLILLSAAMMTVSVMAQEQPQATAKVQPYWAIQASSNGIGLAMKF